MMNYVLLRVSKLQALWRIADATDRRFPLIRFVRQYLGIPLEYHVINLPGRILAQSMLVFVFVAKEKQIAAESG